MGSEGLKEEEIEMELCLSLGGSYCREVSEPEGVARNVSKTEREDQDLRRPEAKRKREKKLTNDGFCKENDSYDSARVKSVPLQGNECEDRDFEEESGRECKKNKVNDNGLIQNDEGNINQNLPVQCLYPCSYLNPQFVTGIVFPCGNGSLIPCWYGKEGNGVINPVMSYGFGPFQVRSESGLGNGDDWEQKFSGKEEKTIVGCVGSSLCSSSGSSDRKSSSHDVRGSSDTRSHSSCSLPEKWNGPKSSNTKSVSEHSATSHQKDSSQVNEATDPADGLISSNSSQSSLSGPKEVILEIELNHTNKEILTPADVILGLSKETKREMGKPPKPQTQKQTTPSFSFMPCVSTRGDGPDGKTIKGFLHRYTKTEVSIICLCHGTSFSPAEFVQHAGGKDVSHPLRHITVMPPAF